MIAHTNKKVNSYTTSFTPVKQEKPLQNKGFSWINT